MAARFHLRASRARLRCRFRNVQRPRRYENVRVGEAITVDDESGFRGERRATVTENKIEHYAWREQPEDYVTCLALRPYRKEEVKGLLKKCNLASDVRQAEEEDISVH